jgi:DNA recombination protein RmuC
MADQLRSAQQQAARLEPLRSHCDAVEAELRSQRERREQAERESVALRTRLEAEQASLAQQRLSFEDEKRQLGDAFRAMGSEALAQNNQQFLTLAEQSFQRLAAAQDDKAAAQRKGVGELVKPIHEALEAHKTAVMQLSHRQAQAYGELSKKTELLATAHTRLDAATNKLHHSLSRTDVRGRWGEVSLRNVIELAGMTQHADFRTQVECATDEGKQRPDLLVNLPGRGCVVVDAKVPLKHYLDAHEEGADREACQAAHAKALRGHVRTLADKAYWKNFERTPELVVLYMPLESALSVALQADPALHTDALESRVLIATPMTLMALLSTIAYAWRQEAVAENARKIADVGKTLSERIEVFVTHYAKVGRALDTATKEYNKATGSLDSRVLASVRKLSALSGSVAEREAPDSVETSVRLPAAVLENDAEIAPAAE